MVAIGLINELVGFTGTMNYYSSTFGKLKLTDGMNYLRNKANCYWLVDIVESVQGLSSVRLARKFLIWKIEVDRDKSFKVTAREDTESELVYEQKGGYTDFPLRGFEFYQCDDVLLLKGEY